MLFVLSIVKNSRFTQATRYGNVLRREERIPFRQ